MFFDLSVKHTSVYFCEPLTRCRKLPRALKEWQAFEDLRKTIDDFNEMVPLLELMANKAMKTRHWNRMQETTGHAFDVESENFTLRSILSAPLLQYKEDIEVWLFEYHLNEMRCKVWRKLYWSMQGYSYK